MNWIVVRRLLGAFLSFGITIPVWLILAGGLWIYCDKASAVRTAVNSAIAGLVYSAEIEAAKAREKALLKIINEQQQQAERDRKAIEKFEQRLAAAEAERDRLYDEIAELESTPAPDSCVVDDSLIDRLRTPQ